MKLKTWCKLIQVIILKARKLSKALHQQRSAKSRKNMTKKIKLDFKPAMFARVKLNFTWYSRVSAITLSLLIFLRAASVRE